MAGWKECCYLAGRGIFVWEGLGQAYLHLDSNPPTVLARESTRGYRCPSLLVSDHPVRSQAGEERREDG